MKKKIVVLVSGGGTNLQAIIDSIENGSITNAEIACVVSSKEGAYALERAKKAGIDTLVVPRKNFNSNEEYSLKLLSILKEEIKPDLIVLAGFMIVLTDAFIDSFVNKIVNVHPSLIPSFCGNGFYGLKVHEAALERGVKVTGATVHFVNKITDGGPIIIQKAVKIMDDDTPEVLQKRVMTEAEWHIMPEAINLFCNDKLEVIDNKVIIKK
ncbi:MAG: phosphoribosylglycinamide formyltransferase [Oscillospiraceae bacterium]|nr:phosphoribosylglycinamide formyltransferase [Oscillospiraceae bacterium]MDD6084963.1 phosphoribosylglycinamide formyltransferase [Oscillospiraceae bacterium]MDY3256981.1 phosphoribosylglycinamide formyltransferase [Ruminococcus callidus]